MPANFVRHLPQVIVRRPDALHAALASEALVNSWHRAG
jgi:hypothetical protein